jgi:hypothetical protein
MRKIEMFFDRYAWKVLLVVFLNLGFFGVNDMVVGTADLQIVTRVKKGAFDV